MRIGLKKDCFIYIVALAAVLFVSSSAHSFWWNASVQQKKQKNEGPTDYANHFGDSLRTKSDLFPNVPKDGPIRWYQVLGVAEDATSEEVRKALIRLYRKTHTDKGMTDRSLIQAVNGVKEEVARMNQEPVIEYEIIWDGKWVSQGGFTLEGPGVVPSVETVGELFARCGDEEKADLVDSDTFKNEFQKFKSDWKRFYMTKWGVLLGALIGSSYLKKVASYEKSWVAKNKVIQAVSARWARFKADHSRIATLFKGSIRGAFIAAAVIYPLYRFNKIFSWAALDRQYRFEWFRNEKISEDDIQLFYRRVHVANEVYYTQHGRETRPIYEPSYPVGYMTSEQARKEFMPLRKAHVLEALTVASSLAATWIGLI